MTDIESKLKAFIEVMNAGKMSGKGVLTYSTGVRYFKIVSNGGAWGFIDKNTGDVLKPKNWNAPAKHARGNINDANLVDKVEWTGPRYLK